MNEVHHQHGAHQGLAKDAYLDVSRAAAQPHQHGVLRVGRVEQRGFGAQDALLRVVKRGDIEELNLADHARRVGLGCKAAAFSGQLGSEREPGNHRGFLDGHGHQDVAPVDLQVGGDAQRQAVNRDHVLDHAVSLLESDPPRGQAIR